MNSFSFQCSVVCSMFVFRFILLAMVLSVLDFTISVCPFGIFEFHFPHIEWNNLKNYLKHLNGILNDFFSFETRERVRIKEMCAFCFKFLCLKQTSVLSPKMEMTIPQRKIYLKKFMANNNKPVSHGKRNKPFTVWYCKRRYFRGVFFRKCKFWDVCTGIKFADRKSVV